MRTKRIDASEVKSVIDSIGDKFFTVSFVKRTDNTLRTMNCRRGVRKGVKGTGHRSHKKGLYTVYSMGDKAWRNINLSGVRTIVANGVKHIVKG
jgi:hypothetical protein